MIRTAYDLALKFDGVKEIPGVQDHPAISWMFMIACNGRRFHDETAWCSVFVTAIAKMCGLPHNDYPASMRARAWLTIGKPVELSQAIPGFDIVILKRGGGFQPGPEVLRAIGHVGFFAGIEGNQINIFGGNQSNGVNHRLYPQHRILGIRRLFSDFEPNAALQLCA